MPERNGMTFLMCWKKKKKQNNLSTWKSAYGKTIPQMKEKIRFLDKQKVRESVSSRSAKRSHSDWNERTLDNNLKSEKITPIKLVYK